MKTDTKRANFQKDKQKQKSNSIKEKDPQNWKKVIIIWNQEVTV